MTAGEIVKLEQAALAAEAEGRYESAVNLHGEAIACSQRLDRPRLKAALFNRLGRALEANGQVQKAVVAYETGFQLLAAQAEPDLRSALESLRRVGKEFYGERESALSALYSPATALDLEAAEADPLLAVKLLINIGNAYLGQPQLAPALNAYEQALARPEIAQDPALQAHALTHVGIIRRRSGELESAGSMLAEALTLLEAHAGPAEKRAALAALAGVYRDQGDWDRALETYQQALAFYAEASDRRGLARTKIGLAQLFLERDLVEQAGETFREALSLAEETGDQEAQWHGLAGLGRCQRAAGQLGEAIASFKRALDLIESRQDELRTDEGKVSFLESVLDISDELIAVHLARAETDAMAHQEALAASEEARGQALGDLMEGRERKRLSSAAKTRETRYRSFPERVPDSPAQMAPAVPHAPKTQMAAGMPASPADIVSLLSQMAPATPAGPRLEPPVEPAAKAGESDERRNPPPLARLVFHVLSDRTAVFAVTPRGEVHGHVAPLGREAIGERVKGVRRALKVDDTPRGMRALFWGEQPVLPQEEPVAYEPLLQDVYAELIAPLADFLPTDGTPVVIEPHGPLWLLPFAALCAPDGTWLADRWPLLYTPSHQILEEIRGGPDYGSPADLKALIVGNPTMPEVRLKSGLDVELDPLPGAEQEARAIAELFDAERHTLLLGGEADRARVESLAPQHGVLHLATHGVAYAEDPLASFVALAAPEDGDGLLTARQVMSLALPADLVALSACQTGLGKVAGEGMIGLSRAFLVAGARAVLVSQWSVGDEATAALMTAFYRDYLELDDKALALQRAMREVRSTPGYEHPRYWAPFLVVGAEA